MAGIGALAELLQRHPEATTFKFGDGAQLSEQLTELVRSGKKVATCGALRDFSAEGEALPVVGRQDIVLNWDGTPALLIETVSVVIAKFCDVTEEFALLEGEDENLGGWQQGHRRYFERNGGFDPEMKLVCECFRLVCDLHETTGDDKK